MSRFKKSTHTVYECSAVGRCCRYHVVFCPKYRHRILKEEIAEFYRQQLYQLARGKELVDILELNIQSDHVHMLMSMAPKYSVSGMMWYLKGKPALRLLDRFEKIGKRYWGRHLWSRGYCVSTVGLDEEMIRKTVRWQEEQDRRIEQGQLGLYGFSTVTVPSHLPGQSYKPPPLAAVIDFSVFVQL